MRRLVKGLCRVMYHEVSKGMEREQHLPLCCCGLQLHNQLCVDHCIALGGVGTISSSSIKLTGESVCGCCEGHIAKGCVPRRVVACLAGVSGCNMSLTFCCMSHANMPCRLLSMHCSS